MEFTHESGFASQVTATLNWTLLSQQGDFSNGVWIGFAPNLTDPAYLSYFQPEKVSVV